MKRYGGGWQGSSIVLTRHDEGRKSRRDSLIVPCVDAAQKARKTPPVKFSTKADPKVYGWGQPGFGVDKRLVAQVKRRVGTGGTWHVAPDGTGKNYPALVYVLNGEVRGIVACVIGR